MLFSKSQCYISFWYLLQIILLLQIALFFFSQHVKLPSTFGSFLHRGWFAGILVGNDGIHYAPFMTRTCYFYCKIKIPCFPQYICRNDYYTDCFIFFQHVKLFRMSCTSNVSNLMIFIFSPFSSPKFIPLLFLLFIKSMFFFSSLTNWPC